MVDCICVSKAFDRVKHSVLFDKLVQRGVPGYMYSENLVLLVCPPDNVCQMG